MKKQPQTEMLYGTSGSEILAGYGSQACLAIRHDSNVSPQAMWELVAGFLERHKGSHIMGYLGYSMSGVQSAFRTSLFPKVFLFVPESVERICAPTEPSQKRIFSLQSYLDQDEEEFLAVLEKAVVWAKQNSERVTLARKIALSEGLDLKSVFRHPACCDRPDLLRTFYLKHGDLSFAGSSPELLLKGTVKSFSTHKLSGTLPKGQEISKFLRRKTMAESKSSMNDMRKSLSRIGVTTSEGSVLHTGVVTHFLTEFTTEVKSVNSATDCLRAVWPYGTSDLEKGLAFIAQHEIHERGPYYGLVGVVFPDGTMEFSQTLRTYFRQGQENYVWVGSAVTAQSTPEVEFEEARLKLRSFPTINIEGEISERFI